MCFYVVRVDGKYRAAIDTQGRANRYGEPKRFDTRKQAERWIQSKSYPGMSWTYEIKEG